MARERILIRAGYLEHFGYYAIAADLMPKTKMAQASIPARTPTSHQTWHIIHRCFDKNEHEQEVQRLLQTGKYMEGV